MSELVDFLLARIGEVEAAARRATPGPWRYNPRNEWHTDPDRLAQARAGVTGPDGEEFVGAGPLGDAICVAATGPANNLESMADAEHIARHDPARVLAECAAKRAIVAEFEEAARQADGSDQMDWTFRGGALYQVLLLLAAVYSDHPDYDEAWKP